VSCDSTWSKVQYTLNRYIYIYIYIHKTRIQIRYACLPYLLGNVKKEKLEFTKFDPQQEERAVPRVCVCDV